MRGIFVFLLILLVSAKPARQRSLPKIIWTFKNSKNINIVHDLCIEHFQQSVQLSGWIINTVTPQTIKQYFRQTNNYFEVFSRFDFFTKMPFGEQMELYKLLILHQNGGLWIHPSTILTNSIDQTIAFSKKANSFQQSTYQLIVYENSLSANVEQNLRIDAQNNQNVFKSQYFNKFGQTDMMLALRQSKILKQWIQRLLEKFQKHNNLPNKESQQINLQNEVIKVLNEIVFPSKYIKEEELLTKSFVSYGIWRFLYIDYSTLFQSFSESKDKHFDVNFYIKYSKEQISLVFGQPLFVLSLKKYEEQLSNILNPEMITTLIFYNEIPFFQSLCQTNSLKCIHNIVQDSIIHHYLLKNSQASYLSQIKISNQEDVKECLDLYSKYTLQQFFIGSTAFVIISIAFLFWYAEIKFLKIIYFILLEFSKKINEKNITPAIKQFKLKMKDSINQI